MWEKGHKALFLIAGLLIVTGSVWVLRPRPEKPQLLPTLWIFYARATGLHETLYGRHYSARGRPLGKPLRIGALGLIQQIQGAASGLGRWEWVTTGHFVVGLTRGRVSIRRRAPARRQILSVAEFERKLYSVVEGSNQRQVSVAQWTANGWHVIRSNLPIGITTLVQGPQSTVWVLTAQPDRAYVTEVQGGNQRYKTPPLEPQGTMGFWQGEPVIPFVRGSGTFGFWDGLDHRFPSVYRAAVSVTDTAPLWGLGVYGMIPFSDGRFNLQRTVPWPSHMPTTPEPLSSGTSPWVAVFSGFSQGIWFNVNAGRFGPSFQIKTPWWAVVRAASLGS